MDAHTRFDNVEAISGQSKLPLITHSPSVKLTAYKFSLCCELLEPNLASQRVFSLVVHPICHRDLIQS